MTADYEKEVEEELEEIRSKFAKTALTSQREVVQDLGRTLEKVRKTEKERQSICQEIKHILREEIARELISERSIENHCQESWKNSRKAEAGKKGAEKSAENISAEMLVTTDGTTETFREPVAQALKAKRIEPRDADEINKIVDRAERKGGKKIPDKNIEDCIENYLDFKRGSKEFEKYQEKMLVETMIEPEDLDEKMERRRRERERIDELADGFHKMRLALTNLASACDVHFRGNVDNPEEITKRQKRYMDIFSHVGARGGIEEIVLRKLQSLEKLANDVAVIRNEMAIIQPIIDAEIKNRRKIDDEKLR